MPAPRTVLAYELIVNEQLEETVAEVGQTAADAEAAAADAAADAAAAQSTANAALPKSGGTMTGQLNISVNGAPLVLNSLNSTAAKIQFQDNGAVRAALGADGTYPVIVYDSGGASQVAASAGGWEPTTDNASYLGRNDDDTPKAWKGLILKDQSNGKAYRIEMVGGVLTPTDLTD